MHRDNASSPCAMTEVAGAVRSYYYSYSAEPDLMLEMNGVHEGIQIL